MNYLRLLELAAPEAILTLTALLVLTVGLVGGRRAAGATISTAQSPNESTALPPSLGFAFFLAALGLLAAIFAITLRPAQAVIADRMLVISPLNSLFQIICLILAFFTVLLTRSERFLPNKSEYLALLLLATIGLMLLIGSEHLLIIFIGLELLGLSLYILTAFDRHRQASAEAGLKYFLFGSVASAFTLFGLSFVYGMSGTLILPALAAKITTQPLPPLFFLGLVMTLIGFAFKIAAAPFHLWVADTYRGAPVSAAAFIASGSKVASFVVLGKILLIGFAPAHGNAAWHALAIGWTPVLATLSALSILVGNLLALVQKNVRRLLAYSAVAHAGYTLLGLVANGADGFAATLFYTTVYAVTLIGAFAVVGFVRQRTGGDDLTDFAGLRHRSPWLAGCMAVFMLSLAGLPPLVGFFGKFYLFSAAMRAGSNHGLLWLVALALFGSLISLYYYLIVLKVIFLDQPQGPLPTTLSAPPADAIRHVVAGLLALAVLALGLFPAPLLDRIIAALPLHF